MFLGRGADCVRLSRLVGCPCIMAAAMRIASMIAAFLILGCCIAVSALPGCEEVLEVCQPCGILAEGDRTISGDPRIDGTFEALQEIRLRVEEMARDHEQRLEELMTVFSISEESGTTALKAEVARMFGPSSASPATTAVRWSRCFVDWESAVSAELSCERRLCNSRISATAALCRGFFIGGCPSTEEGGCYRQSDDACDGLCIGVCSGVVAETCTGTCRGTCEGGTCFAFDSQGACSGHCTGKCSGSCEFDAPFGCDGVCTGLCSRVVADAGCDELDEIRGGCSAVAEPGSCRGHLFVAGCDEQCRDCLNEAQDCREMAKFIAWSRMTCDPTIVTVSLDMTQDPPEPEQRWLMAHVLERIFAETATDHAWLSLAVDGLDLADELEAAALTQENESSRLDDAASQYFDADNLPVDSLRAQLPLENLKARVVWLQEKVPGTEAGYRVAAGPYDCVLQALKDAAGWVSAWVPVAPNSADSADDRPFVEDRACATVPSDSAVPCLYELLAKQSEMLGLLEL